MFVRDDRCGGGGRERGIDDRSTARAISRCASSAYIYNSFYILSNLQFKKLSTNKKYNVFLFFFLLIFSNTVFKECEHTNGYD